MHWWRALPSRENPGVPFPATTVNAPPGEIRTTTKFKKSEAYTFPWLSMATAVTGPKGALRACVTVGKTQSVPATVVITCARRHTAPVTSAASIAVVVMIFILLPSRRARITRWIILSRVNNALHLPLDGGVDGDVVVADDGAGGAL